MDKKTTMNQSSEKGHETFVFRKATSADETQVWKLLREAAAEMLRIGRTQWDEKYPDLESVRNDIMYGECHVMTCNGKVAACMTLSFRGEPEYLNLEGKWNEDGEYSVIHRMAVGLEFRGTGLSRRMMSEAERLTIEHRVNLMRIDTNFDNVEMLALVNGSGFIYCGKVHYFHGGRRVERVAFDKILSL